MMPRLLQATSLKPKVIPKLQYEQHGCILRLKSKMKHSLSRPIGRYCMVPRHFIISKKLSQLFFTYLSLNPFFHCFRVKHIGISLLNNICCRQDSLQYKQLDRVAQGDDKSQMTSRAAEQHATRFLFLPDLLQ